MIGNELQVFKFENAQTIRVTEVNGEPWVVAGDVLRSLGYSDETIRNLKKNLAHVPDEWKGRYPFTTPGGMQDMTCLSEQGLYFFLARSDKLKALPFQKWIAGEVIPSIRKHGAYMTDDALTFALNDPRAAAQMLLNLADERDKRVAAEKQAARLAVDKKIIQNELTIAQTQLDESMEWFTVKRVALLNNIDWRRLSWKSLKNTSLYMEYDIKKIFDANYGSVNAYHIDIWRHEYPHLYYGEN